ncbi:Uncharacterized protein DBV15_10408, partial [Temnothorax longispinosus]
VEERHYGSALPEEFTSRLTEDSVRRPLYGTSGAAHRVENSWWPGDQGGGSHAIRERDNNAAVAGELVSRIAGCLNMAGYLKAAGATCASTGNPHQYHPHGHPMGVGTHPHPHSHPHPGAHPGLPSHFALTPHAHTHHALEHGLAAAFPQANQQISYVPNQQTNYHQFGNGFKHRIPRYHPYYIREELS